LHENVECLRQQDQFNFCELKTFFFVLIAFEIVVSDLFDNPIAQETGYRLLIIHVLPSVSLLDRQGVFIVESSIRA